MVACAWLLSGPGLLRDSRCLPYSPLHTPSPVWLMPPRYAALSRAQGGVHGEEQVVKPRSAARGG